MLDLHEFFADHCCLMISVRRASLKDRARILDISSKIWDGEDYVPGLLESWLMDQEGELAVATWDGLVIAFAHRTWLRPGIAWLEGIRTDPAWEGRGAARAITQHFIRGATAASATQIHLSTHIDNEASIHIIESYGFSRTATFSYVERRAGMDTALPRSTNAKIGQLPAQEALKFVNVSPFLALAHRRFPRGWRFFPFDHAPDEALARIHCLGLQKDQTLHAVLCHGPDHEGAMTINFLDGEVPAMKELLHHVLQCHAGTAMAMMVPWDRGQHANALDVLKEVGFTSWTDFKPDVFAYELVL